MRGLSAEFRDKYAHRIREGYKAFTTAEECPYQRNSDDRTAWRYGWDWADRRAAGPPWAANAPKGRPVALLPAITGRAQMTGDYDVRGQDYETQLIGPVTDTIIDAARLADVEHNNGMPNFALYRLILAGDRQYLRSVRMWWVLFAIEWCRNNMRGGFSDELATIAAHDSLQRMMEPGRPILPAEEVAKDLGVSLDTYLRAREGLRQILSAALRAYWDWIQGTYRIVRAMERRVF